MNISSRRSSGESGIRGPGIIPDKWGDVDPGRESFNVQEIPRRTAAKAILESWCDTRKNGAAVIQADGCPIPGSSRRCSARHNSQEGGDVLIYTSGSRRLRCDWQSVIYTRVAWETAITKSKSSFLFITGHFQILFIPGHFPDFVYTRSLSRLCLYQVTFQTLFIKGVV